MPKVKTSLPQPTREKGQRSLTLPAYLDRNIPTWRTPEWLEADIWRAFVANQPTAVICRETLISYILALDWKIEPRDSTKRDEYKSDIDYYTKFFQYTGDYDYVDIIEWVGKDLLDIPFGGVAELGRNAPNEKLQWIELLDGGTCSPTLNKDWPVEQRLKEDPLNPVYFPDYAINRVYYSPRTEIRRKGWGMPPPEKIFLAISLLSRGDRYYANLLLDTPQVGILDLADMEKTSAEAWIQSWQTLLKGIDPFKIPVLYQHEKPISFIPFTRPPGEIMFDKAIGKYASICAAGYGLSLSDIGESTSSSGGETLSGSIRQERRTRRTGFARAKKKIEAFFNRMLPDWLQLLYIDLDDEQSVAISRARLANATAISMLIKDQVFTAEEMRTQTVADGLITISVPEKLPKSDIVPPQPPTPFGAPSKNPAERPSILGRPVAPSAGGTGEIRNSLASIIDVDDTILLRAIYPTITPIYVEVSNVKNILEDDGMQTWNDWHDEVLWGNLKEEIPELTNVSISSALSSLDTVLSPWWMCAEPSEIAKELHTTFRESRTSILQERNKLKYEKGDIVSLPDTIPNDISAERKFKIRIAKSWQEISETISDKVKRAIIAGVRRYLSLSILNEELDVDAIMNDNNVLECVRAELLALHNRIIVEFAQFVNDTIYDLVKEK
jgi:hypothetical protein